MNDYDLQKNETLSVIQKDIENEKYRAIECNNLHDSKQMILLKLNISTDGSNIRTCFEIKHFENMKTLYLDMFYKM